MKTPIASLLSLLVGAATLVAGEPAAGRFPDRLTGDWAGRRAGLADAGVEVFAFANAIVASNVSGGIRRETNYAGDVFAGAQFDLGKLAGWDATTFTLSGINRHGSSIDASVGSQYSVMQLVGGQATFLYGVYLEHRSGDGAFSFKLGRMTATDDFVGSPLYGYSLNNSVDGQIRAALFDGVMTSYPFPVWGGQVKLKLNGQSDVMVGVFQISRGMFDPTKHGLDFSIRSGDGVSIFTQCDWNGEVGGRTAHAFAGMNNAFMDLKEFSGANTTSHFVRFYGHGDLQVYREAGAADAGLTVFATLAWTAQDEIAIIPLQSTLGAHYRGLFPGRPKDRTVAFVTYGGFGEAYSRRQVRAGGSPVDYELVIEAGHRVQLTKFAYVQPDVQLIRHPGGTGRITDAVVVGVQFGASF